MAHLEAVVLQASKLKTLSALKPFATGSMAGCFATCLIQPSAPTEGFERLS